MITVCGFKRVKDPVIGETRDLRALWALEETGLPYLVHGLDYIECETQTDDYRRVRPRLQLVSSLGQLRNSASYWVMVGRRKGSNFGAQDKLTLADLAIA